MEPATLIGSLTLFALAIFLGFELITKVPPTLHTPLMSGANAISGISIVGAILGANVLYDAGQTEISGIIAFFALILATINVVGGFRSNQQDAPNDRRQKEKRGRLSGSTVVSDRIPPLCVFLHIRFEDARPPADRSPR